MEKAKYKTKQRDILMSYFVRMQGKHVTAGDVCEHLKSQGASIGQSTVYRQIEKLVDEGVINKYVIEPGSPACFEYCPEDSHREGEICFHCKCVKCGKLIHLHCDELERIGGHLLAEHGFTLDTARTVIYGVCDECRSGEESQG